ncbi:hypothetical protein QFC21_003367 [Naganishia friedmannii]|uniref:Uncharacterized protein n=1 Tax=Naganishia friedmannii TaxID=89922 RepID=A0ACC2VPW4_9TREE|nr:hypothetical protein QFC21_003367 [Naganishia friedmannii]
MFLSCLLIAGICVGYAWLLRYIRVVDRVLVVADSGGEGLLGGRETPPLGSGEDGYLALPSHEHQHGRLSLPNFSPTGTNSGERQLRTPSPSGSFFPPSSGGGPGRMEPQLAVMSRKTRTIRAGLYAVTVGISFFPVVGLRSPYMGKAWHVTRTNIIQHSCIEENQRLTPPMNQGGIEVRQSNKGGSWV